MQYQVDVNNPQEDPFVYYTHEDGRKLKARIELLKPGFWGRKGKMILYIDTLNNWPDHQELTLHEFRTILKRIIINLNEHDLIVEFR